MLVYVVGRAGRAGVKDEIKFNFLPAPSFFLQKKKTESRLMMVLDSGAGTQNIGTRLHRGRTEQNQMNLISSPFPLALLITIVVDSFSAT